MESTQEGYHGFQTIYADLFTFCSLKRTKTNLKQVATPQYKTIMYIEFFLRYLSLSFLRVYFDSYICM